MKIKQDFSGMNRFFIGLCVFVFSAGTVVFVTDPYLMADVALVILGLYLMVSGVLTRRLE